MNANADHSQAPTIRRGRRWLGATVWLVFLLGVALRFCNLGTESIDLEEYACLGAIDAPNWPVFMEQQRELYPYGAPLAPQLIYFWSKVAGASIFSIRLLFACVGVAVMILCYCFARTLFSDPWRGRKAGLVVLVMVAFSPVHVFLSQEARMYPLVSLFALLSILTLLYALRSEGRGLWWLHWGAVLGLLASHYFTVFLLPVLGIAILLYEKRLSRRALLWGASQVVLVALMLLWISQIPSQPDELYSYYDLPSMHTIMVNLLASDSTVMSATSFFPSTAAWSGVPERWRFHLLDSHWIFDGVLLFFSLIALGGGFFLASRHYARREYTSAYGWTVLLLWALLPLLLLGAVSLLWRPLYGSRYVMYSFFAIYLLLGGVLSSIERTRLFVLVLLALMLTYGYQLSVALPSQTRAAWRQSVEQIEQETSGQALLLLEDPFWQPVLEINFDKSPPVPVAAAFQRNTLCHASAYLTALSQAGVRPALPCYVLLVLTTDFDETPFATCILESGLIYQRTFFSGERRLSLYRVRPEHQVLTRPVIDPDRSFDALIPLADILANEGAASFPDELLARIRYMADSDAGFWLRLGITLGDHGYREWSAAAFARALQEHPGALSWLLQAASGSSVAIAPEALAAIALDAPISDADMCRRLRDFLTSAYFERNVALLEVLGQAARHRLPTCFSGYMYQALAAHVNEEHATAVDWFEKACAMEAALAPELIEAYGISLIETQSEAQAIAMLEEAIENFPEYPWLYVRLGMAHAAINDHAAAAKAYHQALESLPNDFYLLFLLLESNLVLGHYEQAATLARQPAIASDTRTWVVLARWQAFAGAGADEEAAEVMRRLIDEDDRLEPILQYLYVRPNPALAREALKRLEADGFPMPREMHLTLERLQQQHP